MIINREIEPAIKKMAKEYPVVTITGPRQSGKTTLAKSMFSSYKYYSLEDPDTRELAIEDPRAFLDKRGKGIILDEIQRVPQLLSYIQGLVDSDKANGKWILTGSHQFELLQHINQSLAGRTVIFKLLPFSINELMQIKKNNKTDNFLLQGFYPAIHDRKLNPTIAYKNYFETYIERDLRQIINIKDLRLFRKFVKLCAGRVGSIVSASSLANEVGVSVLTIQSWLSVLEASFVIMLLEPYHANINKRLLKSPKLYFYDVGLAAYLLGIEDIKQVARDPLRGNLFENLVLMELIKKRFNMGLDHNCYFYRDSNKNEVDIMHISGRKIIPIEIKSSETFHSDYLKGLKYIKKVLPQDVEKGYLIYGGSKDLQSDFISVINYKSSVNTIP